MNEWQFCYFVQILFTNHYALKTPILYFCGEKCTMFDYYPQMCNYVYCFYRVNCFICIES